MKIVDVIAAILLIVGGLNWGLVGVVDFNLVTAIFGFAPIFVKLIYFLVGVSATWAIYRWISGGCHSCHLS